MKNLVKSLIVVGLLTFMNSCEYERYEDDFQSVEPIEDLPYITVDPNPDNDPLTDGLENCEWSTAVDGKTIDYPIAQTFPDSIDLSSFMPPVGSQGSQGSCASWATSYYLGSYLKNIENDSLIDSNTEILSSSFAFNQIKLGSGNCYGSSINDNFELMKNIGTLPIEDFPIDISNCIIQPDSIQLVNAQDFKISSYESIGPYYSDTQPDIIMPVMDEVKSALIDGRPVIISMMTDLHFGNVYDVENDIFIINEVVELIFKGCHAMTIVGYDDSLDAFKLINSWGSNWANEGYIYLSYDFFRGSEDPDFKVGVSSLSIAFRD
ncbi:papain like protease [Nonlabens dokdonensis]|uniref:Papain like protease n=2 Tax=Nonlabens dokdonensis TaxID=328515 RepID=A0ABX5PYM8_9FLAO|nr:C1 family peptidase [Nonlabens dokdonensis]AGC77321.1 putative cysteine protease [Nonlabens dokdonensis DSW-6]PZX40851.1 papain like protease [Nonlabens dokdonensis]